MKIVTHHRYKGLSIMGTNVNLPYGTELKEENNIIMTLDNIYLCYKTSENAKRYFTRDDDGFGLERGAITYAIAFSDRKSKDGFRFSEKERELITSKYSRFLVKDLDMIIFNTDFFFADIEELRTFAKDLKINYGKK